MLVDVVGGVAGNWCWRCCGLLPLALDAVVGITKCALVVVVGCRRQSLHCSRSVASLANSVGHSSCPARNSVGLDEFASSRINLSDEGTRYNIFNYCLSSHI